MIRRALLAAGLGAALAGCHAAAPVPVSEGLPLVSPAALGFDSVRLDSVTRYLRTQVDSAFPGAVVAVGRHGRLALLAAVGHYAANDPRPVDPTTIYDLASLTKVVGLTTICMMLVDEGKLDLDAPVQRYVPAFRGPGKDQVKIRHLLTHSAGLVADLPLFDSTRSRAAALAMVDSTTLLWPPGTHFIYSDLSAIVLMQAVESITGEPFDRLLQERVFGPLGMTDTRFRPPRSWRSRIAPTEVDTFFRHRLLVGEVHDESAWRLGGVSGNAGLFSNAPDLSRLAAMLLAGGSWNGATLIHSETVAEFIQRQDLPPGSSRALGWDTPSQPSSAGTKFSPRSFGHTGYTGTSMWMDPDKDLFIILLTNRVNPTRTNTAILHVRPRVADLVADALTHPEF
ncbi:MAG TPA: serine hydrolase domain-containing protein [Gemmatimonadales bacterium]|nr:serine hydrolase domain-containing protein [Gemmatimonadales bacterium]